MLSNQSKLPPLPVPPLQQTLDLYCRYVEPMVAPAAFARTRRAVDDFARSLAAQRLHAAEHWQRALSPVALHDCLAKANKGAAAAAVPQLAASLATKEPGIFKAIKQTYFSSLANGLK